MRSKKYVLFIFMICLLFAYGLYDSPLSVVNRDSDFKVDAEYINGILTASGILFGIWAIIIERMPEEEVKKWQYKHIISKGFWFSFVLLIVSVLLVTLTAVNFYSSTFTLLFCTLSFLMNASILTLTLYFYKFKITNPKNHKA